MSNNDHFGERVNVVEEEIALDAALERLEAARVVVAGLEARLRLGGEVRESLQATIDERDGYIHRLVRLHIDLAADLAKTGSYDHRGKNEAILAVIARLLAYGNNPGFVPAMDDLPF